MAKQNNTSNDWRLLAERDMSVAEHLSVNMRPVPTEIIAFLCQQSAEKYLKGALVILGEEPPYTHDLPELCKLAEASPIVCKHIYNLFNHNSFFCAAAL